MRLIRASCRRLIGKGPGGGGDGDRVGFIDEVDGKRHHVQMVPWRAYDSIASAGTCIYYFNSLLPTNKTLNGCSSTLTSFILIVRATHPNLTRT